MNYIVKKVFVPIQEVNLGSIPIKVIYLPKENKTFFGIGEDQWVIENGFEIKQESNFFKHFSTNTN